MEQDVKRHARRKRFSLPLALLAAVVVLSFFGMAATSRMPEAAAPPLPEFTVSTAAPLITPPPSAAETPAAYVPDEAEVEMLARLIWGEARGVPSDMHKAAVVWCVLNRVDDPRFPDTVLEVLEAPYQFAGYSADYPVLPELATLAADVLIRYHAERDGGTNVGRVLPVEYLYFTGDGRNNHFTIGWKDAETWDWCLQNPYND